jgi:hypothetical protein
MTGIFGPPADYQPSAVELDLARYVPTDEAVAEAVRLLRATPEADVALIPIVAPGKDRGIWTMGQPVETVPGVVILAKDHDLTPGEIDRQEYRKVSGYGTARTMAETLAHAHLGNRPGVAAYSVVSRNGHPGTFEAFGAGGLVVTS